MDDITVILMGGSLVMRGRGEGRVRERGERDGDRARYH